MCVRVCFFWLASTIFCSHHTSVVAYRRAFHINLEITPAEADRGQSDPSDPTRITPLFPWVRSYRHFGQLQFLSCILLTWELAFHILSTSKSASTRACICTKEVGCILRGTWMCIRWFKLDFLLSFQLGQTIGKEMHSALKLALRQERVLKAST